MNSGAEDHGGGSLAWRSTVIRGVGWTSGGRPQTWGPDVSGVSPLPSGAALRQQPNFWLLYGKLYVGELDKNSYQTLACSRCGLLHCGVWAEESCSVPSPSCHWGGTICQGPKSCGNPQPSAGECSVLKLEIDSHKPPCHLQFPLSLFKQEERLSHL